MGKTAISHDSHDGQFGQIMNCAIDVSEPIKTVWWVTGFRR